MEKTNKDTETAGALDLTKLLDVGSNDTALSKAIELLGRLSKGKKLTGEETEFLSAVTTSAAAKGNAALGDKASGEAALEQAKGTKARLKAEAESLIPAKADDIRNSSFIAGGAVPTYDRRMFLARAMTASRRREIAGQMGFPSSYLQELDRQIADEASRVASARKGMYGFSGRDEKTGVASYNAFSIHDSSRADFNSAVSRALARADRRSDSAGPSNIEARQFKKAARDEARRIRAYEGLDELLGIDTDPNSPKNLSANPEDRASVLMMSAKEKADEARRKDIVRRHTTIPTLPGGSRPITQRKDGSTGKLVNDPYAETAAQERENFQNEGTGLHADALGGAAMSPRGWLDAWLSGGLS